MSCSPLRFSIALAAVTCGLAAQRVPDVRVDRNTTAYGRNLGDVEIRGDAIHVIYTGSVDGVEVGLFYNTSQDRGVSWRPTEVRLDTPNPFEWMGQARMAVSGDHVYVTWRERQSSGTAIREFFRQSFDGGTTWLPPIANPSFPPTQTNWVPEIAGQGLDVFVVWAQEPRIDGVYFTRSEDGGLTWTTPTRIDRGTAPVGVGLHNPQVAISGQTVLVTYLDGRNGVQDLYFSRSTDGGATWPANDVRLNTWPGATQPPFTPRIHTSGAKVWVAWSQRGDGFRLNRSLDGGMTWLPADVRIGTPVTAVGGPNQEIDLAISGNTVHALWIDNRNNTASIRTDVFYNHSTDDGVTWDPVDVRIDTPKPFQPNAGLPKLEAIGNNLVAGWWEGNVGEQELYFNWSSDGGDTWLAFDRRVMAAQPKFSGRPNGMLLVAGSGTFHSFYSDLRDGGPRKIYTTIPFGLVPYDAGLPGAGGLTPRLSGNGVALLGNTVTLDVTDGLGGTGGAFLIGGAKASIPLLGGTVLIDQPSEAVAVFLGGAPGQPGQGTLSLPILLPVFPQIIGLPLYFQLLTFDPAAPGGVSMSNGLELWFG